MVLPRNSEVQQSTSELPDFSQVRGLRRLGLGRYTITSLRQRLLEEARGCFYAAKPDSDSETDSYDPTRECYHIDWAVETTDKTQDAAAGGRARAAREDPRTPGNDPRTPFHRKTGLRNLCSYESSRQSSTKTVSASSCSSKSSSKICLTRLAEVSVEKLERYTGKSSETWSQSNPSAASLEQARM